VCVCVCVCVVQWVVCFSGSLTQCVEIVRFLLRVVLFNGMLFFLGNTVSAGRFRWCAFLGWMLVVDSRVYVCGFLVSYIGFCKLSKWLRDC
jgi:hypothetical protein